MPDYDLAAPYDELVRKLVRLLNPAWIKRQRHQPVNSRHVVVRWLQEARALPGRAASAHGNPQFFSGPPSGELQEIIAFAIDVDIVQRVAPLPSELKKRLRDPREYQGVRYELAAAATVARAGLPIVWQPAKIGGPEFWADIPGTGERLAVEAKSRRRAGAIHEPGSHESTRYLADVAELLSKAEKKQVQGRPLIIFIDLNLEDRPDVNGEPAWMPQIRDDAHALARRMAQPELTPALQSLADFHFYDWTPHDGARLRQPLPR